MVGTLPTLAEVRREKNMSQRRLAALALMQASAIGAIEAGHVRVFAGWKARIATALGIEPDSIDWTPKRG
jgi:transcriptional regulator with XRE-family HTH domain